MLGDNGEVNPQPETKGRDPSALELSVRNLESLAAVGGKVVSPGCAGDAATHVALNVAEENKC